MTPESVLVIGQDVVVSLPTTQVTGTVLSNATVRFFGLYIIKLDSPLKGERAIIMPTSNIKPLSCRWCLDTKKVGVTPFTIGEYISKTIPDKPCPYCTRKEAVSSGKVRKSRLTRKARKRS